MVGRVQALVPHFEQAVHSLKGAKHVADIRNYGLAAGFTIAALPGEPARRPYEIAMACWKKGFTCATAATPSSWRRRSSAKGRDRPPDQRAGRRAVRNGLTASHQMLLY